MSSVVTSELTARAQEIAAAMRAGDADAHYRLWRLYGWVYAGRHFGYPECCVAAFALDCDQGREPGVLRGLVQASPTSRYVPCEACEGGKNHLAWGEHIPDAVAVNSEDEPDRNWQLPALDVAGMLAVLGLSGPNFKP